jgi:RNA polymerase sigma-70 factor (ECF subfamily)
LTGQHPTPPDADLVREALAGRREAFDALVERHFGLVYVIALGRLAENDSARDLTQEVFLRAYLQLPKLRERDKFAAWVARMARNLGIQWVRTRQTASRLVPLVYLEAQGMAQTNASTASPRSEMERREDAVAVRDAILKLPAAEREMVLLHYIQGLPQNEIASRLGLHPSTITRTLERARTRMKPGLSIDLGLASEAIQPPPEARARTLSCIAMVAVLNPAIRDSLAVAAGKSVPMVVSSYTTESGVVAFFAWLVGLLQNLQATAASGVLVMGYGKTTLAAGAVLVAAIAGGVAVQQSTSTTGGASSSAVVAQATPMPADAPLTYDYPKKPGDAWRTTAVFSTLHEGSMTEIERCVARCEIVLASPSGDIDVMATIEKIEILMEYRDGISQAVPGLIGRQFVYHLRPDGGVSSVRAADGRKLEVEELTLFLHATQGVGLASRPPSMPLQVGQSWSVHSSFAMIDQPGSRIDATDNIVFTGYQDRDGVKVAVIETTTNAELRNLKAVRFQRPPAVVEIEIESGINRGVTTVELDPRTGRALRAISESEPLPINLVATVTIPRRPPSVKRITESEQASRVITTFEYLY